MLEQPYSLQEEHKILSELYNKLQVYESALIKELRYYAEKDDNENTPFCFNGEEFSHKKMAMVTLQLNRKKDELDSNIRIIDIPPRDWNRREINRMTLAANEITTTLGITH